MLLLYVLEAPTTAILNHLARHLPVDEILVAIPADPPLAARIAAEEVDLAAARLGAPTPRLVTVTPHTPTRSIHALYQALGDHQAIHAYIDANPAATTIALAALTLHTLTKGSTVTLETATRDPAKPVTRVELHAIIAAAKRLPPRLHDTARILQQRLHLTPQQLAREKKVSTTTAKRMLRQLEKHHLAEEKNPESYTPTPLLTLYLTIHEKHTGKQRNEKQETLKT